MRLTPAAAPGVRGEIAEILPSRMLTVTPGSGPAPVPSTRVALTRSRSCATAAVAAATRIAVAKVLIAMRRAPEGDSARRIRGLVESVGGLDYTAPLASGCSSAW